MPSAPNAIDKESELCNFSYLEKDKHIALYEFWVCSPEGAKLFPYYCTVVLTPSANDDKYGVDINNLSNSELVNWKVFHNTDNFKQYYLAKKRAAKQGGKLVWEGKLLNGNN